MRTRQREQEATNKPRSHHRLALRAAWMRDVSDESGRAILKKGCERSSLAVARFSTSTSRHLFGQKKCGMLVQVYINIIVLHYERRHTRMTTIYSSTRTCTVHELKSQQIRVK